MVIIRSGTGRSNMLCVFLREEENMPVRKIAYHFAGWRFFTRYLRFYPQRRRLFQAAVSSVVGQKIYDENVFVCIWQEALLIYRDHRGDFSELAEVETAIIQQLSEARKFYNRHQVKIRGWYNEFG